MKARAKICGLSTEASVLAAIEGGAAFVGFVHFPRSPRHIDPHKACELKQLLPDSVKSVSVVVDPTDSQLEEILDVLSPDFIQLHGSESPERIRAIQGLFPAIRIIKAIKVATLEDIHAASCFYDVADMLLFDAAPPKGALLPGGNGLAFDWEMLRGITCPVPWFVSGGLAAHNVREAIARSDAHLVDVSSGVESAPGVKSEALIKEFLAATQQA